MCMTHINMQKIGEVKSESNLENLKENWRCENSKHVSFQRDESSHVLLLLFYVNCWVSLRNFSLADWK